MFINSPFYASGFYSFLYQTKYYSITSTMPSILYALHPLFPLRDTKRGIHPDFLREYSATKNLCDKNSRPLQFIQFAEQAMVFLLISNEI